LEQTSNFLAGGGAASGVPASLGLGQSIALGSVLANLSAAWISRLFGVFSVYPDLFSIR
jgi:hypothetical protein